MYLRLLIFLVFLAKSDALYENSEVHVLTPSNFNEVIRKRDQVWIVQFYAPWCYYSQQIVPEYKKLAAILKNSEWQVAAMDASDHDPLYASLYISSFPTIKIFYGDKSSPILYKGERTAKDIKSFVEELIGIESSGDEPNSEYDDTIVYDDRDKAEDTSYDSHEYDDYGYEIDPNEDELDRDKSISSSGEESNREYDENAEVTTTKETGNNLENKNLSDDFEAENVTEFAWSTTTAHPQYIDYDYVSHINEDELYHDQSISLNKEKPNGDNDENAVEVTIQETGDCLENKNESEAVEAENVTEFAWSTTTDHPQYIEYDYGSHINEDELYHDKSISLNKEKANGDNDENAVEATIQETGDYLENKNQSEAVEAENVTEFAWSTTTDHPQYIDYDYGSHVNEDELYRDKSISLNKEKENGDNVEKAVEASTQETGDYLENKNLSEAVEAENVTEFAWSTTTDHPQYIDYDYGSHINEDELYRDKSISLNKEKENGDNDEKAVEASTLETSDYLENKNLSEAVEAENVTEFAWSTTTNLPQYIYYDYGSHINEDELYHDKSISLNKEKPNGENDENAVEATTQETGDYLENKNLSEAVEAENVTEFAWSTTTDLPQYTNYDYGSHINEDELSLDKSISLNKEKSLNVTEFSWRTTTEDPQYIDYDYGSHINEDELHLDKLTSSIKEKPNEENENAVEATTQATDDKLGNKILSEAADAENVTYYENVTEIAWSTTTEGIELNLTDNNLQLEPKHSDGRRITNSFKIYYFVFLAYRLVI